jgi:hypothetical protein
MGFVAVPDILHSMQAAEEFELQELPNEASPVPWWEASPFHGSSPEPSAGSSSFVSVLSALASPQTGSRHVGSVETELDDEEDLSSLSYESALRVRAHVSRGDCPIVNPECAATGPALRTGPGRLAGEDPSSPRATASQATSEAASCCAAKSASVTIRLSDAENAQLRTRAAEAGLTISAYVRSCTFEAEILRAKVKEALAQLRAAPEDDTRFAEALPHRERRPWWPFRPHGSMSLFGA